MKPILPSQDVNALNVQVEAKGELVKVIPTFDPVQLGSWIVVMPSFASITQGDYLHFNNGEGISLAVSFDKDNNGTVPGGGTLYDGASAKVQAEITTGMTTTQIADAFITAVTNADAGLVAETYAAGSVRLYMVAPGDTVDITPKNVTDAGAGSMSSAVTAEFAQVSSPYFAQYFTLNSPSTAYYVWFDINDQDAVADPAPAAKTEIRVDLTQTKLTAGISKASILSAMKTAIDDIGDGLVFKCDIKNNEYITISCLATGTATNVGIGTMGTAVSVNVEIQGHAEIYGPAYSVASLSNTSINAITGA